MCPGTHSCCPAVLLVQSPLPGGIVMVPEFMPKGNRAQASLEPLRVDTVLRMTSKWSSVADQQSNAVEAVFTKQTKNQNHA